MSLFKRLVNTLFGRKLEDTKTVRRPVQAAKAAPTPASSGHSTSDTSAGATAMWAASSGGYDSGGVGGGGDISPEPRYDLPRALRAHI